MTLSEKAEKYDMEPNELTAIIMAEPKNKRFFKQRDLTGNLDSVTERAIDEIMAKQPAAPADTNPSSGEKEKTEVDDFAQHIQSSIGGSTEVEETKTEESTQVEQKNEDPENKEVKAKPKEKPKRTRRAQKAPAVEVESEIDRISNVMLRKFYAENFSVKPEKIFFMDDASVREKVDEKYIVIERENDCLFLKRNASVISMAKED